MLLIRPLLRANGPRERKAHIVVFFIFVVSNCGGLLTPLGDPPLFLGFLKGVPFDWTFQLWPEWLLVNGALLAIFNVWDQVVFDREERERPGSQLEAVMEHEPLGIEGAANFAFLAAIVAVIYAAGSGAGNAGEPWPFGVQEGLMIFVAVSAYATTPGRVRARNAFGFGPIIEVAVLFAGIFVTMAPALLLLNANAKQFGLSEPWQFFWAAGLLSSFLDNAPTYLTFAATACGLDGVDARGALPRAVPRAGAESGGDPRRDLGGRRVHGREHVHRQRAELHGEGDRGGERHPHAELLRLHGLLGLRADPALRGRDLPVLPLKLHSRIPRRASRAASSPRSPMSRSTSAAPERPRPDSRRAASANGTPGARVATAMRIARTTSAVISPALAPPGPPRSRRWISGISSVSGGRRREPHGAR